LERLGARIERDEHGRAIRLLFGYAKATDETLVYVKGLRGLQRLEMPCIVNVTDAGLANLEGLSELRFLWLGYSGITDQGLIHLAHLTNLEELHVGVYKSQFKDAGLVHLSGLKNLKKLTLVRTGVTDGAIGELKKALPRCTIETRK
jgi:internalin A